MKPILLSTALLLIFACNNNKPDNSSGQINFKQASIHYEKKGAGDPILLLHGGFLEHTMWDPQIADLSKEYTVITIDLPGHESHYHYFIRFAMDR